MKKKSIKVERKTLSLKKLSEIFQSISDEFRIKHIEQQQMQNEVECYEYLSPTQKLLYYRGEGFELNVDITCEVPYDNVLKSVFREDPLKGLILKRFEELIREKTYLILEIDKIKKNKTA